MWQALQKLRVCPRTRSQRSFSMFLSPYLTFFSNSLFRQYRDKGDHAAHATTSLGIAHDLLMWEYIFRHTFHRSIAEQLNDGRETVWIVDAWQHAVTSRFTFVDSRQ